MAGETQDRRRCLDAALIGFGEAAETFARAASWGLEARAFDIDAKRGEAIRDCGLVASVDAAMAVAGADIVLSLVTADQALDAASEYGRCCPKARCGATELGRAGHQARRLRAIEAAGGRYVDVAVMAPVDKGAGGAAAAVRCRMRCAARPLLEALGFTQPARGRRRGRPRLGDQDDPLGHGQGHRGADRRDDAPRPRRRRACSTR